MTPKAVRFRSLRRCLLVISAYREKGQEPDGARRVENARRAALKGRVKLVIQRRHGSVVAR